MRDKLGICHWFHYGTHAEAEWCIDELERLGIRLLRTGVSWADYHRPGGKAWYDWLLPRLSRFDLLVSVWHTPPSLSEGGTCASPPRVLKDYADFIDVLNRDYGEHFSVLELWNEPNNHWKWDFVRFDPTWRKLGQMLAMAGHWAKVLGKKTVLGGMIPVDHHWLRLMDRYGALQVSDVVGIHAFPGMWWTDAPCWDWSTDWTGWDAKVGYIAAHAGGRPIWVTETGLATWDLPAGRVGRHELQSRLLEDAARAPVERVYWYSLRDLAPERAAIEGFHVDENEYHLGLFTADGQRKPAWHTMKALLEGELLSRPSNPLAAPPPSRSGLARATFAPRPEERGWRQRMLQGEPAQRLRRR